MPPVGYSLNKWTVIKTVPLYKLSAKFSARFNLHVSGEVLSFIGSMKRVRRRRHAWWESLEVKGFSQSVAFHQGWSDTGYLRGGVSPALQQCASLFSCGARAKWTWRLSVKAQSVAYLNRVFCASMACATQLRPLKGISIWEWSVYYR